MNNITCDQILLACDLDRTILPNGKEPCSKQAAGHLQAFIDEQRVVLAYLSGRSFESSLAAIEEYNVPKPSVLVANVGTTIYKKNIWGEYVNDESWEETFNKGWKGISREQIADVLRGVSSLMPQEDHNQQQFKQSYYVERPAIADTVSAMHTHLSPLGIEYTISVHEDERIGYLDVIPATATKEHALRYLQESLYLHKECVVYAGDGGNDLPALTAGFNAIVVKNATADFKKIVKAKAKERDTLSRIYFAKGNYLAMNGNYIAGIVEGLHHFGYIED